MKCFIDPVVYFIIVIMMPDGVLGKKKSQLTFTFITIIQSLCAHCFVEVALSFKGTWTGKGSQGAVIKEPSWIAFSGY